MNQTKIRNFKYMRYLLFSVSLIILQFSLSSCGFNANIFLTSEERQILKNDACKGPAVIFINTPSNQDIVKRWRYLCPLRKISLTDDKNANAALINAAASFQPDKNTINTSQKGTGLFCTSNPILQSLTVFAIPLICNYQDIFGPCIKRGTNVKCANPPVAGDAVEYIGWIPIITHSIPHFIGSLWSDNLQDRIIAGIQSELNKAQ